MQVNSVRIEMLGGFSVWVNGEVVLQDAPRLTKPWQLFCYLVLNREKFVSSRRLISILWPDDMLTDPANVLKNAVYSLRKELCGGESFTESPIIYSTGGYRFDPAVKLQLDTDAFTQLYLKSKEAGLSDDEQLDICRQAVDAYRGDFLPQLDADLWVVPLCLEYKRKYLYCVHALCQQLVQRELYKELLMVATTANAYEILDEKTVGYLFRAMDALKMYRVIVTTYSKLARQYDDALGGKLPMEATRVYNAASERINKTEQDIIVIKAEIIGSEQATRPPRGAYYCSYSNLRHTYSLMKRTAERNRQTLVLALFTVSPAKGVLPEEFDLERAMAEFKVVAMNALRKSDTLSRYSANQYVMLLSVTSLEDGRLVRDRIKTNFALTAISRELTMDIKLAEV